jgi:hypothetical protein
MPSMLRFMRWVPVVLLAGCTADPSPLAHPESYDFDCDVPPGNFSQWSRAVNAGEVRISGVIQVIEPRSHTRWAPVATVTVSGKEEVPSVGVRAMIDGNAPDEVRLVLLKPDGLAVDDPLVSVPWEGKAIPFTLSLDGRGDLKVSVIDQSRALHLAPFPVQKLKLGCSTGEFKFSAVTVTVN